MKNAGYYLGATLLLFASACSHYCCDAPPPPNALFAQRNNVQWTAIPAGSLGAGDTLTISGTGTNTGSNLHDTLAFKIKYNGLGNYKITANRAFYDARDGNGPPLLLYKLDTLYNNFLMITAYDQVTKLMTGTFQLKFNSPADTSSVTFLYGNFRAPLN